MSFVSDSLYCCATAQSNSNMKLVDNEGLSMLHYACLGQHIGCVQLLLNNAASVLLKDKVILIALYDITPTSPCYFSLSSLFCDFI